MSRVWATGMAAVLVVGCGTTPKSADTQVPTVPPLAVADPKPKPAPSGDGVLTIQTRGLACPLCATNCEKALQRVPGVAAVAVDLGDGRIRITPKPGTSPSEAELAAAVRRAGFTFVALER